MIDDDDDSDQLSIQLSYNNENRNQESEIKSSISVQSRYSRITKIGSPKDDYTHNYRVNTTETPEVAKQCQTAVTY